MRKWQKIEKIRFDILKDQNLLFPNVSSEFLYFHSFTSKNCLKVLREQSESIWGPGRCGFYIGANKFRDPVWWAKKISRPRVLSQKKISWPRIRWKIFHDPINKITPKTFVNSQNCQFSILFLIKISFLYQNSWKPQNW